LQQLISMSLYDSLLQHAMQPFFARDSEQLDLQCNSRHRPTTTCSHIAGLHAYLIQGL